MAEFSEREYQKLFRRLDAIEGKLAKIQLSEFGYPFIPLKVPLTSTSYDGDSFSTTAKTLIDLSAVFGVPDGIKGVLVRIQTLDSASASTEHNWFGVSPNNTASELVVVSRCSGLPNGYRGDQTGPCPCDANGDIYYQCVASGAGTLVVDMKIWGYWL